MKTTFFPFLTVLLLAVLPVQAQTTIADAVINLTGDSNTEQAAKLELIRVLQERLNKLTVSQLNARVIVSRGVSNYYKVDEITKMNQEIYGIRSKYVNIAQKLEAGNPGFSAGSGGGFTYRYIVQLNNAVSKARILNEQLTTVLRSGQPILMPAMPTFSISAASSDPGEAMSAAINQIMASYNIRSRDEFEAQSEAKKQEIEAKIKEVIKPLMDQIAQQIKDANKGLLATVGNLVGTAFGVPGAGSMLVGLTSGKASAVSGLVGSIMDNFQIPTDYYDSVTLKLTDAERLKMIDELHIRMSELHQQVAALGTSLSNETKTRYTELSQPRNESILYGPKK